MNKIIALLDGSVYSESVCDHAAWLAKSSGAALDLVHVLGRRTPGRKNLSGSIGLGARTALLDELTELDAQAAKLAQRRGRAILEDAEARVRAAGVEEVTTRLRTGEFVASIAELESDADMIVIGKRGEAADFEKLHLGSNLERAVRSSHRPIYVANRAFQPAKKVLLAFDGGNSSIKAANFIASSPLFQDMAVHVLSASTDAVKGKQDVDGAISILKRGLNAVTGEVLSGPADTVIAGKVQTDGFDLLVMGAYGHSRIRSLIIGSTTTAMLRTCLVPVLMFR